MPTKDWRRSVAAYKRGQDHVEAGTLCQDYAEVLDREDFIIAALADGVGSKEYSDTAAREAVKGTIRWFISNKDSLGNMETPQRGITMIRGMLQELRYRIKGAALDCRLNLNQMDCNLAFVFVRKNPEAEDRVYYGVLGDCAVCEIGSGDRMATLCGAMADSQATHSVMHPNSEENFHIEHRYADKDDICGFLLTSDGLEYAAYVKRSPYVYHGAQDFYNAIFSQDPESRIDGLFRERQKHPDFEDDLSVAVLSRDNAPRTFRPDPYWLCSCGQKNPLHAVVCSKCAKGYLELYGNLSEDIRKHNCKDAFEYFLYLNKYSDKEYTKIGLAPMTASEFEARKKDEPKVQAKPANTAAKQNPSAQKPDVKKEESAVKNKPKPTATDPVVSNPPQNDPPVDKAPSKQRPFRTILSYATLVLLLLNAALSFLNMINTSGIPAMKSDLNKQLKKIQKSITALANETAEPTASADAGTNAVTASPETPAESYRIELEDGSVYYGEVSDGLPHGNGMIYEGDFVLSGAFHNGKKNGTFLIRSLSEPQEVTAVKYSLDKPIGDPCKIGFCEPRVDMLSVCTLKLDLTVYSDHATNQEDSFEFPAGTMVYLTGEYYCSVKNSGKVDLWLEICTSDGIRGWCKASDLDMFQS